MKLKIVGIVVLLLVLIGAGLFYKGYKMAHAPRCGGLAGTMCPIGYECTGMATYPDAQGICIKSSKAQPVHVNEVSTNVKVDHSLSVKEFTLENKYSLQTPSDFSVTKLSPAITNVSVYEFTEPDFKNRFSVIIHPFVFSTTPQDGKCTVATDGTKVFCEGITMTKFFYTGSNNTKVFYGTNAGDLIHDCTMNSDCKAPPANERYEITYIFVIPKQAENAVIEFFAGDVVRKPSFEVNGFEGVASLLHDSIIPSFKKIGE